MGFDISYGSRGRQVLFTPNFGLLTPLLKILGIRCAEFNFKLFLKTKNPRIFFLNTLKFLKGGGTVKIEPFCWKHFENFIKD